VTAVEESVTETAADPTPTAQPLRPFVPRGWVAAIVAIAGGLAMLLAFPPYGLWWLAPVGVALIVVSAHGQRLRRAAWLGFIAGFAFFAPLLSWTGIQVGRWPWLALAALQAAYVMLYAIAVAWLSPLAAERGPRLVGWPVALATAWAADEALRDRTPFGGFPWGRLAFSQGDAPNLRLAVLGGAPLVTLGVAFAAALLAMAAVAYRPSRRSAIYATGAAVAVTVLGAVVPVSTANGRTVTVAIVQGNVPRLGLDFNAQRLAVLGNHVNATLALARAVAAGQQPQPDLVIWPENASDVDPIINQDAREAIDEAARAINAPILVGGLLDGDSGHPRNVGIVWSPTGGAGDSYTKRHPVPFAEYIPMRSLVRKITTKVDLVRSDFAAGDRPGILTVGPATVGDVICFEVAYDAIVRDTVTGGANLIAVQTNNATFNPSEARQQLAMVRLRAVEHGTDALMVSTVGISAFVTANGDVGQATGFNTQAVRVQRLHLAEHRTVATKLGEGPEWLAVGLAAVGLLWAAVRRRRPGLAG
jgi:apolipoprotein N-acyltransferase